MEILLRILVYFFIIAFLWEKSTQNPHLRPQLLPAAAHSFTLCAVPYPFFFSCRVPVPPSTTPSWSSTATMVPKKHFTSMPKLRCST